MPMRTLYLTRHAKSSRDDPRMDDFHRPLNERGMRDAPFMAQRFNARGEPVDMLVSSPALRAITTAGFFAGALGVQVDRIRQVPDIYLATARTLLRIVNDLPDEVHRVMLFGHNPGFSDLVALLGGDVVGDMPTCATVRIDLPVGSWREVSAGIGTVAWTDHPKRHGVAH